MLLNYYLCQKCQLAKINKFCYRLFNQKTSKKGRLLADDLRMTWTS
jgi:hypothetical protein